MQYKDAQVSVNNMYYHYFVVMDTDPNVAVNKSILWSLSLIMALVLFMMLKNEFHFAYLFIWYMGFSKKIVFLGEVGNCTAESTWCLIYYIDILTVERSVSRTVAMFSRMVPLASSTVVYLLRLESKITMAQSSQLYLHINPRSTLTSCIYK